uniref:Uncharacterized protein n=1 Tax=Clastoptera arizonana TaxID=38151 RepID=A0A1B6CSE3_9HEMI
MTTSHRTIAAWLWILPLASSISVPTGKLTPITPAQPRSRTPSRHPPSAPAPVVEYTIEHPEPPPLDPRYVPITYKYISALSPNSIFYVPVQYRNLNNLPNQDIEYVFPRKYISATAHVKGVDLSYPTKPLRQPPTKYLHYYPIKTIEYNPYKHEFGFTSRDTDYTLPGKSIYGVSGKGSDVTSGPSKDYPSPKSSLRIYKGKGEDFSASTKASEYSRKPSESAYPKKVLDHNAAPRKYSYFVNHKY